MSVRLDKGLCLTPLPALALCGWKSSVEETVERQVLIELGGGVGVVAS